VDKLLLWKRFTTRGKLKTTFRYSINVINLNRNAVTADVETNYRQVFNVENLLVISVW